jgi:hypothetical protein
MLSVFVFPPVPPAVAAKPSAPCKAPPHPALKDFLDWRIHHFLSERAGEAVRLWEMLNHLVALEKPRTPQAQRNITLQLLERVKVLRREGYLVRYGRKRFARAGDPIENPPRSRPRFHRRRRQRLFVRRADTSRPVHVNPPASATAQKGPDQQQTPVFTGYTAVSSASEAGQKTKSGGSAASEVVTQAQLQQAATELAMLPRPPVRKWTGWMHGTHFWHGRKVILPDNEVGLVQFVYRGRAHVAVPDNTDPDGFILRAFYCEQLRVWRNPAAMMMGQAKRGVVEQKSARKAHTSRTNGLRPVHPRSRPRGRPRHEVLPQVASQQ